MVTCCEGMSTWDRSEQKTRIHICIQTHKYSCNTSALWWFYNTDVCGQRGQRRPVNTDAGTGFLWLIYGNMGMWSTFYQLLGSEMVRHQWKKRRTSLLRWINCSKFVASLIRFVFFCSLPAEMCFNRFWLIVINIYSLIYLCGFFHSYWMFWV